MVRNTSDGEEVASDEETLEEAVEKQDWVDLVNEELPFTCLVKARGKKCPYRPFKYRFYLNDHMRKARLMILLKIRPGPGAEERLKLLKKNKKIKNGECKSHELESDDKLIQEGEKRILEEIEAMG